MQEYWLPNNALLAIEFLVLGFLELKRYQGFKETGSVSRLGWLGLPPVGCWRCAQHTAANVLRESYCVVH